MKVRIEDVAQAAGVSVTTVSRVLGQRGKVSPATRKAVMSAVELTGYQRSTLFTPAQARLVVVAPPEEPEHWQLDVCRAIAVELQKHRVFTVPAAIGADMTVPTSIAHVQSAVDAGAAAVITPTFTPLDVGVPVIRLAQTSVGTDFATEHTGSTELIAARVDLGAGMDMALDHLAALGHRRIGLVCNESGELAEILKERFARSHPARTIVGDVNAWVAAVPKSFSGGVDAATRLRDATCTAVVVQSALQTHGVLEAIRRRRLMVPRDLSVVAFGDSVTMRYTAPPMTVLGFDSEAMARALTAAARSVLHLSGEPMQTVPPHFRPRLLARSSTGGAR